MKILIKQNTTKTSVENSKREHIFQDKSFKIQDVDKVEQTKKMRYFLYSDAAPSSSLAKNCVAEFKRGDMSIVDNEHSGRLKTATIEEIVDKVQTNLKENRRLTLIDITQQLEYQLNVCINSTLDRMMGTATGHS